MGAPMAGHLLDAGYRLTVFNRTAARADDLVARGARRADGPAAAADGADVVVTMVGFPADVRRTILADDGALAAMAPGTLLVDMTTSEPTLAVEIHAAAAAREVGALDAPVSGGDLGARNATLVIMAGGDPEAFARAEPLFAHLGRTAVLQGPAGSGQHSKMVNQIAVASGMIGVCEAMLYARRPASTSSAWSTRSRTERPVPGHCPTTALGCFDPISSRVSRSTTSSRTSGWHCSRRGG